MLIIDKKMIFLKTISISIHSNDKARKPPKIIKKFFVFIDISNKLFIQF